MTELGTPIVGDPKYFNAQDDVARDVTQEEGLGEGLGDELGEGLHLHARRLVIPHPDGGTLDITAPLPRHMRQSWAALGFDAEKYDQSLEDEGG